MIQPASLPEKSSKGQKKKEVEPRKDKDDDDAILEEAIRPLDQSWVPVVRGSLRKKKGEAQENCCSTR